jgi:pimeloyl-ACP methyl ester carboxylesterase
MGWRLARVVGAALALGAALLGPGGPPAGAQAGPAGPAAGPAPFAGLVDVGGGRRLYLECRGAGAPTVVLESGYGDPGGVWDAGVLPPGTAGPAVLPGVAALTRVCVYDRPGTFLDAAHRGRSDPAPMPRPAHAVVADLHALLRAAGVPGPYVLVGHSLGGLFGRLYAATYPGEVAGLVLVDAFSEALKAALPPEQWAGFLRLSAAPLPPELAADPTVERLDLDAAADAMRQAAAVRPLRRVPLVVLSAGRPPAVPPAGLAALPPGFPATLVAAQETSQAFLAALVPGARHRTAPGSGHYIFVEQPDLVIAAVREVVTAARQAPPAAVRGLPRTGAGSGNR